MIVLGKLRNLFKKKASHRRACYQSTPHRMGPGLLGPLRRLTFLTRCAMGWPPRPRTVLMGMAIATLTTTTLLTPMAAIWLRCCQDFEAVRRRHNSPSFKKSDLNAAGQL